MNVYDIAVRQFTQEVLPPPLPSTTVWVGSAGGAGPRLLLPPSASGAPGAPRPGGPWFNGR